MIIYNCLVSENYKHLQQGRFSMFLIGGWESHPRRNNLISSKFGMGMRNYSSKSWYEAFTLRKLGILKNSVNYELLAGLVEEYTDFPCFMKLSKMPF